MNKKVDTYKIFRQLEEREKRRNPYSFYDKDELIDEILKNEDELERYKNIIEDIEKLVRNQLYGAFVPTGRTDGKVLQEIERKIEKLKGE